MRTKEALEYEGKIPQGNNKNILAAEVVEIETDKKYLIVDLYTEKEHIYRMVMAPDNYVHYDYKKQKKDKKSRWNNPFRASIESAYIAEKDMKAIKNYAKNIKVGNNYNHQALDYIESIEDVINDAIKKATQEKKYAEMQELLKIIPAEPETLNMAIEQQADRCNIIYYKRIGRYAEYKCCQCGEEYTLRNAPYEGIEPVRVYPVPKNEELMECVKCGKRAVLKPIGYAKNTHQEFNTVLYQVAADGTLIARIYYTDVMRNEYSSWRIQTTEKIRMFLWPGKIRIYYKSYSGEYWFPIKEIAYNTISSLISVDEVNIKNSCLKYIPENMYTLLNNRGDSRTAINIHKLQAIESYARCPQLEVLYKVGLESMCRSLLWNIGKTRMIKKNEKELHKMLKITKEQLTWLMRDKQRGFQKIAMIYYADKKGITIEQYEKLEKLWCTYASNYKLHYALKYMSLEKLWNTLDKYKDEYNGNISATLNEYADYLMEREAQGYDMTNSVYIKPRSLYDTYTRLRLEAEQKKDNDYINKMMKKYPVIAARSKKIPKKYTWQNKGLLIRPARDAKEIVMEGRTLHHCVGSDGQGYMKNYNEGKAWIMVLRQIQHPDAPYITIELKNDVIIQWYGEHNTKPNEDIIEEFLKEYKEHIKGSRLKVTA